MGYMNNENPAVLSAGKSDFCDDFSDKDYEPVKSSYQDASKK